MARVFGVSVAVPADEDALVAEEELSLERVSPVADRRMEKEGEGGGKKEKVGGGGRGLSTYPGGLRIQSLSPSTAEKGEFSGGGLVVCNRRINIRRINPPTVLDTRRQFRISNIRRQSLQPQTRILAILSTNLTRGLAFGHRSTESSVTAIGASEIW